MYKSKGPVGPKITLITGLSNTLICGLPGVIQVTYTNEMKGGFFERLAPIIGSAHHRLPILNQNASRVGLVKIFSIRAISLRVRDSAISKADHCQIGKKSHEQERMSLI